MHFLNTIQQPDPTISVAQMHEYGYRWDGMWPLRTEAALKLFQENHAILCLYPDDTEAYVSSKLEILALDKQGMLFGIEKHPE